ncbi:hypothetical protein ACKKBG_A29920 [Auxenochlorella protothecoides x Auxenochlorella symbiontica]
MPSKSVYNEWLPQHLAERVATEEPARYAALVAALKAQWERDSRTLSAAEALRATQPYIALCRTLYHARADLDSTSLHDLVHCQLEMVAQGEGDLMVQTRWALQLQQLLRTHRSKLSIEVPWRPWYLMLRRTVLRDDLEYEGGALSEARRQTLARLIHRLRRHFPRGSAAEIWDEFKTALRDVQRVDGFEALGWLTMLLPTTALKAGDGDWGAWAEEWVALWRAVPHCSYWDALWGALFARLASHDAFGLIDWHHHLPELYTHFLWAFRVPVGTSFADPPFSFDCPKHCQVLFANELASRSECAAHAAIYMLGHGGGPPGADSALAHLEGLVGLLEQYYHPSNGGRWNSGLAHLFKTLASAFGARLLAESNAARRTAERARGPRGASAPPDAPAGDAEAEVDPGGAGAEEDASVDGDDASEASEASDDDVQASGSDSSGEDDLLPVPPGGRRRAPLTDVVVERVVGALLRLASKAQFSKDKELRRSATRILGLLAEVSPRAVLPGVHAHFVAALETVTSTSVLASAIQTLSLCVRPLLVAGLVLPPEDGGGGVEVAVGMNGDGEVPGGADAARATAGASLAAALMATVPGIDANDPPKSLAVFRFYAIVLSSLAQLPEVATPGFPLETEIWVEELLSHVFAVISNLDAPEHRDEHQAEGLGSGEGEETFLLDGNSMFRPLMELLFSRLPPGLRRHAIQRVGRFLLETTLSSVMAEAAVLCNAVAWADPRLAGELVLAPTLRLLRADAEAAAAAPRRAGAPRLSKAQEAVLAWRINLASSLVMYAGCAAVAQKVEVLGALRALAALPALPVAEALQGLLSSLLLGLVQAYPLGGFDPAPAPRRLALPGSGVELEAFVELRGGGGERPRWHAPDAAELALAREVLDAHLAAPLARLGAMLDAGDFAAACTAEAGARGGREALRALLWQLQGCLAGVSVCLAPLAAAQAAGEPTSPPVSLVGELGAAVGSAREREEGAAVVLRALRAADAADPDTLYLLLTVADSFMAAGSAEYSDSLDHASSWAADEKWVSEKPLAGRLYVGAGLWDPRRRWCRRRPRWLVAEKTFLSLRWRASQAAYRGAATAAAPAPALRQVPAPYLDYAALLVHHALHGYSSTRILATFYLERALKAWPCLVPGAAAPLLRAAAGVPAAVPAAPADWEAGLAAALPALREAAAAAGARAAARAGPEGEADEALGVGLSRLLAAGRSFWRAAGADWATLHALIAALQASAVHTGAGAQTELLGAAVTLSFRFVKPVNHDPDTVSALVRDLLRTLSGTSTPAVPWRYCLLAAAFTCLLLKTASPDDTAAIATTFAGLLTSDLLLLRQVALAATLKLLLPAWRPDAARPATPAEAAAAAAVRGAMERGAPAALFACLAGNHANLTGAGDGDGTGSGPGPMLGSTDEIVAKLAVSSVLRFSVWPCGREAVAAVQDGTFKPEHAALVQALALTAPAVLGPGLRAAVLEALARPQDVDRPATAAAGECLAGLVASGVPFEDGSWDEWVGPALQEALASAPLEQTSAWASGTLRYAAYELATAGRHGALAQLCALVAGPAHPGAGSGAQYRRLKYLNYLLTEIITVLGNRSHPAFLCSVWESLLREVPELVSHPGQMVRVEAARLGALLTASVLDQAEVARLDTRAGEAPAAPRANGSCRLTLEPLVVACLDDLVTQFDASVGIMFAVARDAPVQQQPGTPTPSQATGEDGMDFEAAGAGDDASLASLSPPPHAGPGLTPSELGAAAGSAGDDLDPEVEPSPGSAVLMQHEGAEGLEASPSALSLARAPLGKESASPRFQQALTRVAYCVEFVAQAIQGGEGTVLLPWLVRLLPGMLKIQRLIPSELQAVSMAARKAVSLLKYLPLMQPALVKSVLATLVQACGAELWPERASALVYLQYFWFRHVFLLGTAGTAALVTAVVERLSDAKLEVRDLAAATLSGLLKGMEESKTASLRAAFLADVERLLPAKRGRKRMVPGPLPPLPGTAAAAPGPSLARRHAAVQGLRAFVLSSPYDVPAWLPGVLMALVRLAGEPAPIRVTVTKTLAEFRRTHEEAGLSEVRDQLTSEQWEAIRDVAHPAPYFV